MSEKNPRTIKQAQSIWKRRTHQYLVGYVAAGNFLYGRRTKAEHEAARPVSLTRATKMLRDMPCAGAAIFRVEPMAVIARKK